MLPTFQPWGKLTAKFLSLWLGLFLVSFQFGPAPGMHFCMLFFPEAIFIQECQLLWVCERVHSGSQCLSTHYPLDVSISTHLPNRRLGISIPGSGRSPGDGNGNPVQYSCVGNPMDRGTWPATIHGVTKSRI